MRYDREAMIALSPSPLDVTALTVADETDGAVCIFIGVVRGAHRGRIVTHLEYEAYDEMALEEMARIEAELRSAWPITEVRMVHRLGRVAVGGTSVVVVVTSPHRTEAFAACRQAIDALKARVPIWKKEHYSDGAEWLDNAPCKPPE
jgi:molybdopterin synthase catalytic subunit